MLTLLWIILFRYYASEFYMCYASEDYCQHDQVILEIRPKLNILKAYLAKCVLFIFPTMPASNTCTIVCNLIGPVVYE